MYSNSLIQKLQNREPVAGCIIQGALPALVEICGLAGFDFVWIDAEHAPLSERDCEDLVRAAEVRHTIPLVRVPSNTSETIMRYLDVGCMGVIIPGVTSRAEVEAAVKAVKYNPSGSRGLTSTRTADFGLIKPLAEYVMEANAQTLVLVIIENPEAVEHLEEILSVDGLDGAIFGGTDLSAALGVPGQWQHETVQQAFQTFIECGLRSGKPIGTVLRPGETAKELIEKGITIIAANAFSLFASQAKSFVSLVK
jgi:4-hydroxy-2-oxoheptanedioate aldolase